MQVGDLVRIKPDNLIELDESDMTVGIVMALPNKKTPQRHLLAGRVGVKWNDGNRIDWEPIDWLEVLSEGR